MKPIKTLILMSFAVMMATLPVFAQQATVDSIIREARAECKSFENGTLTVDDAAIVKRDLTGDGVAEELVDTAKLSCSTAASLFCGTGGCSLYALVEGKAYNFLAKGWKVVELGKAPVLLLAVHGSECGGTNLRRCTKALTWSEGAFQRISAQ